MSIKIVNMIFALFLLSSSTVFGCTAFILDTENGPILARNMDFYFGDAYLIVNKRGIQKRALLLNSSEKSNGVKWTSKYGCITLNPISYQIPCGGINEAGLVVVALYDLIKERPKPDQRTVIDIIQWIQYQLDNHRTVDEVIDSISKIRISNETFDAQLHYLICDSKGRRAVIEIIAGKEIVYRKEQMPISVLANAKYQESLKYIKKNDMIFESYQSTNEQRITRALQKVNNYNSSKDKAIKYAFQALDFVKYNRNNQKTYWSVVYDPVKQKVYFNNRDNMTKGTLDLNSIDFSQDYPEYLDTMKIYNTDLNSQLSNYDFSTHENFTRNMITKYLNLGTFLSINKDNLEIIISRTFPIISTKCE